MFRKESISPTPQPTLDNVLTDFDFDSFLVDNDNGVQDFDFRSGFASSTVSEGGGSETKQDSVSGIALALRKVNAPTKKIEISYTISQNYTAGEEARRSILLAGFGTRGRPRRLQPQSRPRPQPISRSTPRPSGPGTKDAAATSGRPKEGEERKNRIARLLAAKTAKALAAPNPDPPSAPSNSDMVQVQGLGQGTASATLPKFKSWGENKQLIKQKLAALQKSTEAQAQKSATDTTDSDASQNGTPSSLMPSAMRPGYSQAGTTQLPRYPTYDESDQTPGKPTIYEPARESARRIRERRIRKRIWHSMSSSSPNMPRVGQNPPTSGETTSAEWSPLFPSGVFRST
jgi:pyruvate/2-oxoglutarate dehydrogenase complex dihydrolipoamide acyltransferase (E2) component